jgi:hypothetical protein
MFEFLDTIKNNITGKIKDSLDHRFSMKIADNTSVSSVMSNSAQNYFRTSGIFLIVLFIVSIIIYYAANDGKVLTTNTYLYAILIIVPIIIGIFLTGITKKDGLFKIIMLVVIIFLVSITGSFLSNASTSTIQTINYVFYILLFFIVLVGLALFYFVFSDSLQNQRGIFGFIINFIFYIPCLFSDFVLYIKTQIGITPSVVYILFLIEIFLILLYIYLPKLLDYYSSLNTVVLLKDPVYLDVELPIVKDKKIFLLKNTEVLKTPNIDYGITYRNNNYAFSFWVYINPGSKSKIEYMDETNIFNYANGKPRVTCKNDQVDPFKNKFTVYFTNNNKNTDNTNYEILLTIQKWNFFVFNYLDNGADLFVNGVLEKSFYFDHDNIPLSGSDADDVFVGSNRGLYGSICNVKYYTVPLSTTQIANNYNSLMFSNPPIL